MSFELDSRLQRDCTVLGSLGLSELLLMNNSALPWFILVPRTTVTEVIDLEAAEQQLLWQEVARVGEFVRSEFRVDKLNTGAIGNVVSQLHVHVVGRRHDDYCWPDVVWGQPVPATYSRDAIETLTARATDSLLLKTAK